MASIAKYGDGYRAQVYVKGQRETKVFRTKREASAWASARETELRSDANKPLSEKHTLGDAFVKYAKEVSPTKKGCRSERIRLKAFEEVLPIHMKIGEITPEILGKWRDDRLKINKSSSVLRDISIISHVFEVARREWRWIHENPLSDVRRPPNTPHRDRVITRPEIKRMLKSLGYSRSPTRTVSQAVACAFLFALRTGCRAGEICSLPWIKVSTDYVGVDGKTGPRNVPLTRKAARYIHQMKGWDESLVFGLKSQTLDAMFRKYRSKAGLEGFTFHDSRHTAATWIAQKLQVLDLCKMFGWSNPKMAMVYYNPSASDIQKRLG